MIIYGVELSSPKYFPPQSAGGSVPNGALWTDPTRRLADVGDQTNRHSDPPCFVAEKNPIMMRSFAEFTLSVVEGLRMTLDSRQERCGNDILGKLDDK